MKDKTTALVLPLVTKPQGDKFIVTRGDDPYNDPATEEPLTFDTVDEAKAWAYVTLGAIPLVEGVEDG